MNLNNNSPSFFLSASILSANFGHLEEDIKLLEKYGVDWIHIDVMDGQFVPNISMGPLIVETCKRISKLPVDTHLMINTPEKYIKEFADAGSDIISIHAENNPNLHRSLQEIRSFGCKPGVVINPGTHPASIEYVCDLVDLVLVMSVNPGYSGQDFIQGSNNKVLEVHNILSRNGSNAVIQVDGGVNSKNLPLLYKSGARCFVASNSIFKHPDGIIRGISALRNSLIQ